MNSSSPSRARIAGVKQVIFLHILALVALACVVTPLTAFARDTGSGNPNSFFGGHFPKRQRIRQNNDAQITILGDLTPDKLSDFCSQNQDPEGNNWDDAINNDSGNGFLAGDWECENQADNETEVFGPGDISMTNACNTEFQDQLNGQTAEDRLNDPNPDTTQDSGWQCFTNATDVSAMQQSDLDNYCSQVLNAGSPAKNTNGKIDGWQCDDGTPIGLDKMKDVCQQEVTNNVPAIDRALAYLSGDPITFECFKANGG